MKKLLVIWGTVFAFVLLQAPAALPAGKQAFRANLTGLEEVPARTTDAHGLASFVLNREGTEITYRIIVSNIANVTEAHIHLGARGESGPAVVILYGPVAPGGGAKSGMLATGVITAASLTGPLAGKTIADLVNAMRMGDAYVNVHTNDGSGQANRGAGDFPEGEIRGQIQ